MLGGGEGEVVPRSCKSSEGSGAQILPILRGVTQISLSKIQKPHPLSRLA